MQISQRASSTNQAPTGTFIVDRFVWTQSGVGKVDTSASGTNIGVSGLKNAARITVDTVDTSIAAGDYYFIGYAAEGYDTAKFRSNTFTLSFWVYATLTGTYSVAFRNPALTYSYVTTFTVDDALTWGRKIITVSGGLNSTYFTTFTNNVGVYISWCMAAGTTYTTSTLNSYVSGNFIKANTQAVNTLATANNTFYLSGVQLELGDAATDFDFRPYGTELALCQRYYETGSYLQTLPVSNASVIASYTTNVNFLVTKRDIPNMAASTNNQGTLLTSNITTTGVAIGRSNVVADRTNSGTYVADAEF
jgi:hypothetical protein